MESRGKRGKGNVIKGKKEGKEMQSRGRKSEMKWN